jgi:hypothetical protein
VNDAVKKKEDENVKSLEEISVQKFTLQYSS